LGYAVSPLRSLEVPLKRSSVRLSDAFALVIKPAKFSLCFRLTGYGLAANCVDAIHFSIAQ
jgi:hypothetical protein